MLPAFMLSLSLETQLILFVGGRNLLTAEIVCEQTAVGIVLLYLNPKQIPRPAGRPSPALAKYIHS